MKKILSLITALAISNCQVYATDASAALSATGPVAAQSGGQSDQAQYNDLLQAFELKLFTRTFDNESVGKRLDRIERQVYGAAKPGPIDQRMFRLAMDAPLFGVLLHAPSAPSNSAQVQYGSSNPAPGFSSSDYANYPTVTALEEQILGQTYTQEPVQERLARMETKVFGQSSDNSDLATRVDKLKQYVSSQNQGNENYLTSPAAAFSAGLNRDPYNQTYTNTNTNGQSLLTVVDQMENEVFGKTYSRDTLVSRIDRLDKSVFPLQQDQTFTPLSVRINKLMAALQRSKITASRNTTDDDKSKSKSDHPLLHKLGKFLGGVGTAAGIALGSVAAGSAMGYGYGYGFGGFGYPGCFGGMPYYGGWGYPHYYW